MSYKRQIFIKSRYTPWLSVLICWMASFILSCMLSSMTMTEDAIGAGLAKAVFQGARQAVSTQFTETADEYFHRGVGRRTDLAFTNSFFQKITDQMAPDGHIHLEGEALKESMPWYWLAIKMDPHNIQNYLVAAYCVSGPIGDKTMAHSILQEARRNTTLHHEIELEDAIIYMGEQNMAEAEKAIDVALDLWPSGQNPNDKEAILDKIHILSYKALLSEVAGDRENAAKYFSEILAFTPDDEDLQKRIKNLQNGNPPSHLAKNILDAMVQRRDSHTDCPREHSEHEHH